MIDTAATSPMTSGPTGRRKFSFAASGELVGSGTGEDSARMARPSLACLTRWYQSENLANPKHSNLKPRPSNLLGYPRNLRCQGSHPGLQELLAIPKSPVGFPAIALWPCTLMRASRGNERRGLVRFNRICMEREKFSTLDTVDMSQKLGIITCSSYRAVSTAHAISCT